jgi:hypothetical protein
VGLAQFVQGGPLLALQSDELALVLTNRTTLRRMIGRRELGSARHTQMSHGCLSCSHKAKRQDHSQRCPAPGSFGWLNTIAGFFDWGRGRGA